LIGFGSALLVRRSEMAPPHLRQYDELSEMTDLTSLLQLLKFFHRSLQLLRDLLGIDILLEA
jgi:hypothetical protein